MRLGGTKCTRSGQEGGESLGGEACAPLAFRTACKCSLGRPGQQPPKSSLERTRSPEAAALLLRKPRLSPDRDAEARQW